jgi:hypothetical protein
MKTVEVSSNQLADEIWRKYRKEITNIVCIQLDPAMLTKIYCEAELEIILDDLNEQYGGE